MGLAERINHLVSKKVHTAWRLYKDGIYCAANKEFASDRLEIVCDIFLFSCFTGLAYADVKKLKSQDLLLELTAQNG